MDISESKRKILRDAIDVLYLNGYHGTNIRELAKAAGLAKSTFYSHFESKEEFAIYALDYYLEELNYENFKLLKDKNTMPLDRIRNFYQAKVKNLDQLEYKYGCLIGNLTIEMADVNDDLADATERLHNKISQMVLDCLNEAVDMQGFKPVIATEELANYIINGWQGALVRMKASRNKESLDLFYKMLDQFLLNT